jgi:homoserine O-acetyltransferase
LLEVTKLAIIGGSVGGGIAWEMVALEPTITQKLIPIATDWKLPIGLLPIVLQEQILIIHLNLFKMPAHAMLCYRTPESLRQNFSEPLMRVSYFNVESWLFHGEKIAAAFSIGFLQNDESITENN